MRLRFGAGALRSGAISLNGRAFRMGVPRGEQMASALHTRIPNGPVFRAVHEYNAVGDGRFSHLPRSGYGQGSPSDVVGIHERRLREKKSGAAAVFACFRYAVAV